jgi:hypothetical protein
LTWAEVEDLAKYELSLAGYSLGMTYDEASMIRPFHTIKNPPSKARSSSERFIAVIDQVFISAVEMNVTVFFHDEKIEKVVVRFHPLFLEEVASQLLQAYGTGENRSKIYELKSGEERKQLSYQWDFPGAKITLVSMSTNSESAFVGLVAKHAPEQKVVPPSD